LERRPELLFRAALALRLGFKTRRRIATSHRQLRSDIIVQPFAPSAVDLGPSRLVAGYINDEQLIITAYIDKFSAIPVHQGFFASQGFVRKKGPWSSGLLLKPAPFDKP
jgi:hypothetical protein